MTPDRTVLLPEPVLNRPQCAVLVPRRLSRSFLKFAADHGASMVQERQHRHLILQNSDG